MPWWTADISSSQVSQPLSWESASSLLWPIIAHCSHMLFLFTVTEWGHVIYSEETASNAAPPPEKTLTGGGQKIRGFTSSRTVHGLKLFKFNDTLQPANKNLDNLHGCAGCKLNRTVETRRHNQLDVWFLPRVWKNLFGVTRGGGTFCLTGLSMLPWYDLN